MKKKSTFLKGNLGFPHYPFTGSEVCVWGGGGQIHSI